MAYVYGHYKAYTDELFYIGKGTGNRAWSKRSRNPHWQNVVNKHGLVVKILEDGLTEEQAYEKEKQLIAEVGLENLTNMVKGGKGFTSEEATQNMQKLLQDPEWRRKNKEHREKIYQDPEWRKRNAEKNRKLAQDPEWCKQIADKIKQLYQDPEYRKKRAEATKSAMQDPEWIKTVTERNRRTAQDPEWRRKQTENNRKLAQDPGWRRKQKEGAQRNAQDPEYRKKMSEIKKLWWEQKRLMKS